MPSETIRPPRSGRAVWSLTESAFEGLLRTLDSDRDRAAIAYEQLRDRIIGLLRFWGAGQAEELTDETLDRVARKLESGALVPIGSLGAYVRGVARMVYYEAGRKPRTESYEGDFVAPPPPDTAEVPLRRLDQCLEALAADDRALVLRYYGDGKKSDVRRRLAAELELSPTALRIRAHRLRERLERCVAARAKTEGDTQ